MDTGHFRGFLSDPMVFFLVPLDIHVADRFKLEMLGTFHICWRFQAASHDQEIDWVLSNSLNGRKFLFMYFFNIVASQESILA